MSTKPARVGDEVEIKPQALAVFQGSLGREIQSGAYLIYYIDRPGRAYRALLDRSPGAVWRKDVKVLRRAEVIAKASKA